jgi:hypothetical protein
MFNGTRVSRLVTPHPGFDERRTVNELLMSKFSPFVGATELLMSL